MHSNDGLEEVEFVIASLGVWKVGKGRGASVQGQPTTRLK